MADAVAAEASAGHDTAHASAQTTLKPRHPLPHEAVIEFIFKPT
jgi:hypothetical protein